MVINNMNKKDIRAPSRRNCYPVQRGQTDPTLDLVVILELHKFFHKTFENILVLDYVKQCVISEDEDALLALAIFVVLPDVHAEDDLFVLEQQGLYSLLLF
jgi:hypothetical protein